MGGRSRIPGVILFCSVALAAAGAEAAVFTVTRTDDPEPGACAPGDCSLREAVIAANATLAADRIVLPAGDYVLSREGVDEDAAATGDLDVTRPLAILGAGAEATSIDGAGLDRVFHFRFESTASVGALQDLTVKGGLASPTGGGRGPGGGVLIERGRLAADSCAFRDNAAGRGGAIHVGRSEIGATASLDLRGSVLANNTAVPIISGGASGGGIFVDSFSEADIAASELRDDAANDSYSSGGGIGTGLNAVLRVSGSTIANCTARFGAGAYVYLSTVGASFRNVAMTGNVASESGGAIMADGALEVVASRLEGNRAAFGGAIYVQGSPVAPAEIADSALSGNFAVTSVGGGMYSFGRTAALSGTTLDGNTANAAGGGYYQRGGVGVLQNVTVTGNTVAAPAGVGGGVALRSVEGNSLLLHHATIADNGAASATQIYAEDEGLPPVRRITVQNSVVQGAAACGGTGTPISEGGNVDAGQSCEFILASDVQNADAKLQPLAQNGGPTRTRAPGTGSAALDAARADFCLPGDQRGYARSGLCDAGAYDAATPAGAFACGPSADGIQAQLGYALEENLLAPPATAGDATACLVDFATP